MREKLIRIDVACLVAALSQPWSTTSCLLAQGFGGDEKVQGCGAASATFRDGSFATWEFESGDGSAAEKAAKLQAKFDQLRFLSDPGTRALRVAQIAEQLPIQLPVKITPFTGLRNITITEATLAKAESRPWSTTTCLIATALGGPSEVFTCGSTQSQMQDRRLVKYNDHNVGNAQGLFDEIHGQGEASADRRRVLREKLVGMLPLTFEAEYIAADAPQFN